ncbi:MAG TPA: hypothetical protein DCQ98_00285 [Planctomycetaceae bacterium]|nr:hypothetical protein [Planctomycetaceae bacterium]
MEELRLMPGEDQGAIARELREIAPGGSPLASGSDDLIASRRPQTPPVETDSGRSEARVASAIEPTKHLDDRRLDQR